ncbi:MAG: hypothetical protein Q8P20_10505 [bacterium]|nr:hypothetical protein [bacterium]
MSKSLQRRSSKIRIFFVTNCDKKFQRQLIRHLIQKGFVHDEINLHRGTTFVKKNGETFFFDNFFTSKEVKRYRAAGIIIGSE